MELQTLLVLCGVGVTGIAVLLLMGLFSTSGTSYEEAIAQQRKATTELLALAESKKPKKNNKKAIKKLAKKERKESNAVATGSDPESEAPAESGGDEDAPPPTKPHVEFRPPVVVDISTDTPPNVKIRKRGKDPKVKPILINKEDPSCVNDPSTPPSPTGSIVINHFEIIHPKDEFELLHSSHCAEKSLEKKEEVVEKKETKGVKQGKGGKAATKQQTSEPIPKEEAVAPQRERRNSGEPKEQRKAKKNEKKAAPEEVVEVEREEVTLVTAPPIEPVVEKPKLAPAAAPPAPTNPPTGKNKKKKQEPDVLSLMAVGGGAGGVNVGELVRVVRDAALSRNEIQILTDALLNKHHDQLPEHSEWTEGPNDPMQKLKKQLADKEKALADEVEASQALHAKLKELRASLNAERGRVATLGRAGEQAAADSLALQARLQRLADDHHALTQEKLLLQSKLSAEGEAQAQRVQLEMHIQRLTDTEQGLMQQLAALQAEANARALEVGQARCDAGHARDALLMAQQHALELQQQLQEANRLLGEVEQQRAGAVHAEQLAQQELRQAQDRLAGISELQSEVQRATSRAQAAEANAEQLIQDVDKQKLQLSAELSSVREQLALRETELAELKQLKVSFAHNGLPSNAAEQNRAAELSKVESVVEGLRSELAAATRCSREQRDQLERLNDQLALYQDKNNELRTKNWKIMEALQSAEKSLQAKSRAKPAEDSLREAIRAAQEAQYKEIASVLRGACPAAAPATAAGGDWVRAFADNLRALEPRPAPGPSPSPAPSPDADQLRAHNAHLQALVDKYKNIIDDTEGVLSSLQQNVSAEEQKWAQLLADKQKQLDELQQRTITQMQKKIDSLQEELQQVRTSNHNHSFADTERTTQERLMDSLSDKHKVDVSNGPLQVDLGKI